VTAIRRAKPDGNFNYSHLGIGFRGRLDHGGLIVSGKSNIS